MSQIIKAFTGVYMVLFLMMTGTGILGAGLTTLQAQNIHSRTIDELENSDYANAVIKEALMDTKTGGMQLVLVLYLENGETLSCDAPEAVPDEIPQVRMAEVQLGYPLEIPFVGLQKQCYLVGYAR